jgi:YD repeat-containing protein
MQLRSVCATLAFVAASALTGPGWAGTTYFFYDAQGRLQGNTGTTGNQLSQFRWDSADNRTLLSQEPVPGPSQGNVLGPNQGLVRGEYLVSPDGRYSLWMQSDGNLVVYGPSSALWSSGTANTTAAYVLMQGDGNLVIYDVAGNAIWNSQTTGNANSSLTIQVDGNLVIYNSSNAAVWNTGT